MDISVQAASFNAANHAQSQGGSVFASARAASAISSEGASQSSQNLSSARTKNESQQATNRSAAQSSNNTLPNRVAHTNFEYKQQVHVMEVVDQRDALIYQIPAKGALEIIQAENEVRALEATA